MLLLVLQPSLVQQPSLPILHQVQLHVWSQNIDQNADHSSYLGGRGNAKSYPSLRCYPYIPKTNGTDEMINQAVGMFVANKLIRLGDLIVVTAGVPLGTAII